MSKAVFFVTAVGDAHAASEIISTNYGALGLGDNSMASGNFLYLWIKILGKQPGIRSGWAVAVNGRKT